VVAWRHQRLVYYGSYERALRNMPRVLIRNKYKWWTAAAWWRQRPANGELASSRGSDIVW